ncbi:hypothetical protein AB0442_39025 [Kitasatospora sp. NPDC085895]|uniref:hypothetical protein n=1 Tax=Kitasatospora sp. NPDC085895 TaxID=3155057 RepID=UPI00344E0A85
MPQSEGLGRKHVAALRTVVELGERRAALLAEADAVLEELRPAVLAAIRMGVARDRVRKLARISTTTLYGWLADDDNLPVRKPHPVRTRRTP